MTTVRAPGSDRDYPGSARIRRELSGNRIVPLRYHNARLRVPCQLNKRATRRAASTPTRSPAFGARCKDPLPIQPLLPEAFLHFPSRHSPNSHTRFRESHRISAPEAHGVWPGSRRFSMVRLIGDAKRGDLLAAEPFANRLACSRPSSESWTSVAPANRSSAVKTVAPCRTMKTRVAELISVGDARNQRETQCSSTAISVYAFHLCTNQIKC
jgi:hypothetical protein